MADEIKINIKSVETRDGRRIPYISPHAQHPIWQVNPEYARDVKMIAEPIQHVEKVDDLKYVVTSPILQAAEKLYRRKVQSCDSSPYEDRTSDYYQGAENGVWAYIAVYMDELTPELQERVRAKHAEYAEKLTHGYSPELGRVSVRNLPTMFDEEIPGAYFEVKLGADTKPEHVEQALIDLVSETIPPALVIRS